ncbi:MAG: DUF4175 family protein [Massilia sp.]
MQADADIIRRLLAAVVWRRLPLWLAVLLPWCLLLSIPGILAALTWSAWDFMRLRECVRTDWSRWLDGAVPALEDSSALLAHAESPLAMLQRSRLLARVSDALNAAAIAGIVKARVKLAWYWLAVSLLAALLLWGWQHAPAKGAAPLPLAVSRSAPVSALAITVTPPKYTGVAAFASAPRDLQVPQNSAVQWCLTPAQAEDEVIELSDGQTLKVGAACARWNATESVFWRWHGKRYNLRVLADQPPQINIAAPRDMLQILPANATSATISVTVRDDYAVTRATMHMTLARGSGENIRFSDREAPLPQSSDPHVRSWTKQWSLAELGMEAGDELYFFIRASDNAEPSHSTVSPTYTLRLPGPVEADDESVALPTLVKPENLRSQRQVIIDTEQLLADVKNNPRLPAATVRARSEAIAGDQAMLRRRYGQFLGEESSIFGADEHEEHDKPGEKHDLIAEFGHMHDQAENATLFDEPTKKILRRALSAMWDAEKALRAISPTTALAPENKALLAIKELQQADRIYLHKTAFAPPPLKEEIRMTGDVAGTKSYRREQGGAADELPADMRELLHALDGDGALPALWSRTAHDWIRIRIGNDEQRLEAQRAVQDVADGCVKCRPVLRAWLRGALGPTSILLQATPELETPFTRAWRKGDAP